jgi:hypothetical protein
MMECDKCKRSIDPTVTDDTKSAAWVSWYYNPTTRTTKQVFFTCRPYLHCGAHLVEEDRPEGHVLCDNYAKAIAERGWKAWADSYGIDGSHFWRVLEAMRESQR